MMKYLKTYENLNNKLKIFHIYHYFNNYSLYLGKVKRIDNTYTRCITFEKDEAFLHSLGQDKILKYKYYSTLEDFLDEDPKHIIDIIRIIKKNTNTNKTFISREYGPYLIQLKEYINNNTKYGYLFDSDEIGLF